MGLSKQDSISRYGTEAYTGWGETEAAADAREHPEKLNTYNANPQPTSSSQVTPFLNNFQNSELAKKQEAVLTDLIETPPAPAPINRVQEFENLRKQFGVADLEEYLTNLKAEEENLYADLRLRSNRERGEAIPMGVIEGRVSEIERQQGERIDLIRRLKQTTTDQLNVAYNVISTYINYMGLDYQDAVDAYQNEFQKNLSIYNAISSARGLELDVAKFGYQIDQDAKDRASANLTTMMNAITSGNVNYNDLPADQKLLISKLEAQTGLPQGFVSSLKVNPNDQVLFQTSNEGITQVGFIQPDGSVRVEEYGRRISSGGSGKLTTEDYKNYLIEDVQNYKNLGQVLTLYASELSDEEIIRLYDRYSPFGVHKESNRELNKKYGTQLQE